MPDFPILKGKLKFDNCISIQMLITNNEKFQTTTMKSTLSNNNAIYALNNSEFFSLVISTKRLRSCKSKRINKNKNKKKLFGPFTSTKYLCGHENKHVGKKSKNNDLEGQTATALPAAFTKRLAKRKTAYAAIHSNSSEKTEIITFITTIEQLRSNFLIFVISTKSIHNHESERISIQSNANTLAENFFHISSI